MEIKGWFALVGFCLAVMRITVRMQASAMRTRITPPRIRMRISVLANDFQSRLRNNIGATTLPLGKKYNDLGKVLVG